MPIRFHGLLYLGDASERMANLPPGQGIDVYVGCAANCARSFARFGYSYHVLTNAPDVVAARAQALGLAPLPLAPMHFAREVPATLGFASAHRKLEVIGQLGTGALGEQVALVDLDTELVRPFPEAMLDDGSRLHALDLTREMMAEFGTAVAETLAAILGRSVPSPRWFGGEFLCGPAARFAELSQVIDDCWERYLAQAEGSIHEGDEALTAAALTLLAERGMPVADAGAGGEVARWWSARTNVAMPRFSEVAGAALLHLPADKPYLAARAGRSPDPDEFVRDYRAAVANKLRARRLANVVQRLTPGKRQQHAPRW